jgi:ribosomal protein S18 acetylase RimI-like enzyme
MNVERGKREEEKKVINIEEVGGEKSSPIAEEALEKFIDGLRDKYPERDYYRDLGPRMNEGKSIVSYVAGSPEDGTVGIINGERQDNREFKMHWFVVDPEQQNGEVAKKLWEKVSSDYDRIRLLAVAFGAEKDITEEQEASNQQALIEFYKKLGFKPEIAEPSKLPGGAMPMAWEREK